MFPNSRSSEVQVTQKDKHDAATPMYTGDGAEGRGENDQSHTATTQSANSNMTHAADSLITDEQGVTEQQKITVIQQSGGPVPHA